MLSVEAQAKNVQYYSIIILEIIYNTVVLLFISINVNKGLLIGVLSLYENFKQ